MTTNAAKFQIKASVLAAIKEAHVISGVNFGFLMAMCAQESGFNPTARPGINPKTGKRWSSAVGLYQFLNATWAGMVKAYGKQYGIGLNDREDAKKNAIMGALFARDNATYLKKKGHKVGVTEMYMAHFLGQGGANKFLNALDTTPNARASSIMVQEAAANPSVYKNKDGTHRSLAEVYAFFKAKIEPKAIAFEPYLTR